MFDPKDLTIDEEHRPAGIVRAAVHQPVQLWDVLSEIEDMIGSEVSSEDLCHLAGECTQATDAFSISKDAVFEALPEGGQNDSSPDPD